MKIIPAILCICVLYLTESVSAGKEINVKGDFPFDTVFSLSKDPSEDKIVNFSRYNLYLGYFVGVTLILPPTPFVVGFCSFYPLKKFNQERTLKTSLEHTYSIAGGILCSSPSTPGCGAKVTIDTSGYYFIDSIQTADDTLFIYPKNVWIAVTDTTSYPIPDSVHLQFNYKPGTPVAVKPKNCISPGFIGTNNPLRITMYTIQGVKVQHGHVPTGIYIQRSGRILHIERKFDSRIK